MKRNLYQVSSPFILQGDSGFITSLKPALGAVDAEFIRPGSRLGEVSVRYRTGDGAWEAVKASQDAPLKVRSRFEPRDSAVIWSVSVSNDSNTSVEVGDLALPLPVCGATGPQDHGFLLKHSFISGHGSFLYWMGSDSALPILTLTPLADAALEYWDTALRDKGDCAVYLHSRAAGAEAAERGTRWRQPHTSLMLAAGRSKTYGFKFQWARDVEAVRQILYEEGKIDIHCVPGMTVPSDLFAEFALRTKEPVESVEAEHPDRTQVERRSSRGDTHLYRVRFSHLGENRLTVRYGNKQWVHLEFFSTEPLETLIKKRAAFLARSQHRDPAVWYNGLICDWNMELQEPLTPDRCELLSRGRLYAVTCDDPGLAKPAFLAAKNVEYPEQDEVCALDYYVRHFVWGGLQRTSGETDAYGLYGIPDWRVLRDSPDEGRKGRRHLWRVYDYPHIVLLYFSLYRVARQQPRVRTEWPAEEYLTRAYGTALAMFTLPAEIADWSAYDTGFYNELVIVDLIDALENRGWKDEAHALRGHWERKVRAFVEETQDLFRSEYAFDSTGFESTHALARYALQHPAAPDGKPRGFDPTLARNFLEKQMAANLFCRGVIEPAYYYLGSDYRGHAGNSYTLTYMSQMGGWSVLDYALNSAEDAAPYLRLAYASYLSAWALMNTGTPDSNYGYWYPGKANDGGAGGGFEPAPHGKTWLEQPHHRGSWYYACEIDLGFCGALRAAATILADDPIFGRFCFGGEWTDTGMGLRVIPKDGVRRRFFALLPAGKLRLVSAVARFAAGQAIFLRPDLSELCFALESDNPDEHPVELQLGGLPDGDYVVLRDDAEVSRVHAACGKDIVLSLPMPAARTGHFAVRQCGKTGDGHG